MIDRMAAGELRTAREFLGLTLDALARLLGVREDTLRRWESGREPIPVRVRDEVASLQRTTDAMVNELITTSQHVAVFRTDDEFRAAKPDLTNFTARWWRHVVARASAELPGLAIGYADALAAPRDRG